jgi:hypothetical protein
MMMNTHGSKASPVAAPAAEPSRNGSGKPAGGGLHANGDQTSFSQLSASIASSSCSGDLNPVVADLVEKMTQAIQAGHPVDVEAVAMEHPEHAETIRGLMPALHQLAGLRPLLAAGDAATRPAAGLPIKAGRRLGDFQLLGELGRGGMGVVFEAVQESLGRRVALKILPTAATLDSRARQRFQIEAQAAACLQHSHIVPVYAVNLADEVPYYAMQLVEGMSLADLIVDLRRLAWPGAPEQRGHNGDATIDPLLSRLLFDRFDPTGDAGSSHSGGSTHRDGAAGAATPAAPQMGWLFSVPVVRSIRSWPYFRSVARLGVQAALALEYAHGQGIVHRDVKPANLLLDRRGRLWVTDFGLARLPAESGLTRTGELVGTDRYMSPEQAAGKQALIEPVRAVAIAPDGRTLITLAGERLRFWDAATGKRLGPPRVHGRKLRTDRIDDRAARRGRARLGRRPLAARGVSGLGQSGPRPPARGPALARPAPQPRADHSGRLERPLGRARGQKPPARGRGRRAPRSGLPRRPVPALAGFMTQAP